jgi:hypothetical protein
MQPWFNLKTIDGRARLDTYLTGIRGTARTALHIMIGALHGGTPAQLHTKESQDYIDQIVLRIRETGEPHFGGFTEEQYTGSQVRNSDQFICLGRRKINLSVAFASQNVGVKEVSDKIWLVSFMKYDLGFFDQEVGRVTSAENPFDAKVLPVCPV